MKSIQITAKDKELIGHTGPISSVAMLADGTFATASGNTNVTDDASDGTIRIWDPNSGACRKIIQNAGQILSLVGLPDGKLASGSKENADGLVGHIRIWDINTGEPFHLGSYSGWVNCLTVLPDGTLVSGGRYPDNTIRLWDIKNRKCIAEYRGHTSSLFCLAVIKNKNDILLASGSGDGTVNIWDIKTGDCIKTLICHPSTHYVMSLAALPNGLLASAGDTNPQLWDITTGQCVKEWPLKTRVWNLTALPDNTLAAAGHDGSISLLDINTGKYKQILKEHSQTVSSLALLPDNKTLVSGSFDATAKVWKLGVIPELQLTQCNDSSVDLNNNNQSNHNVTLDNKVALVSNQQIEVFKQASPINSKEKAREFYSKGKAAFYTGNKSNAIAFFLQARDNYKDVLTNVELDVHSKQEAEKRLTNIKNPEGKYSPKKLVQ